MGGYSIATQDGKNADILPLEKGQIQEQILIDLQHKDLLVAVTRIISSILAMDKTEMQLP